MSTEFTTNQPTLEQLTGAQPTVSPETASQPTLDQLTGAQPTVSPQTSPPPEPQFFTTPPPPVPQPLNQPTLDDLTGPQPTIPQEETPTETSIDLPVERTPQPAIFRNGSDLILIDGALPSPEICLKSGRKVAKINSVSVNNPFNPMTWFFGAPKVDIGLDKQNHEKFLINQTIAYGLIGLGLVIFLTGLFSGIGTALFGLFVTFSGLVFRCFVPIWSTRSDENSITVRGCGEEYLCRYPEHQS
ncbi:MAG: hypothetical protein P1U89_01400 [Verrucomicrobiales bacterium]|nr:hypothetical protein [Verrucomicrobiales bacterium]